MIFSANLLSRRKAAKAKAQHTQGSSTGPTSKHFKKQEVISLDSDEEPEEKVKPPAKRKAKSKPVYDDDDDFIVGDDVVGKDDFVVEDEPKPKKAKVTKSPARKTKAAKPKAKTSTPVSSDASSDGPSAQEILKTIPDADPSYLESEMEGLNFFQIQALKAKSAPSSNSREIPEGRPNCLNGLTVVFTGVLPSIDRGHCEMLASRYGAKVTKSISGKTSLVVIGREAGPKKIATIKQKKIKCIG
ncbi:unnamed protein product [Ambrosiozyma monospora]|uniref:Unnamed protein product n=1 Tax=Ambrosiozyma monospora TaxID=43982 RepID=A0ACB5U6T0_AMBMO|nr:unnamed protein product [Ambrosiozyma monospora]